MALLNIGTGISDFRKRRTEHCYYVDKTNFIEEFLSQTPADTTLITRPRRFGKTLTMSMLKEFFDLKNKDKENIFEGLAISRNKELCEKWQNQYPVVFITLKDCDGMKFKDIMDRFAEVVSDTCIKNPELQTDANVSSSIRKKLHTLEFDRDRTLLPTSFRTICQAFYEHYGKKVILLIDEYDVPVNQAYHTDYYQDVIKFIRVLLGSVLKDAQYIQFAVLTGCLRISKESIFTGLNHFECYGISDYLFSSTFGFTSQEVDSILADAGLEDKKPVFKEWYDGYSFGNQKEMYCPWDVLSYIKALQYNTMEAPKMYWKNSSGNSIIKDFLKRTDFDLTEKFESLTAGGCVEISLSDQQTYDLIHSSEENFWNILYLTGYLTKASEKQIQEYGKEPEEGNALLVIPNKEVLGIYNTSIKEWMQEDIIRPERKNFLEAFWNGDEETVSTILSTFLSASMSCRDYYETFYHGAVFGAFFGSGCKKLSNRESGLGYYDLFITHPIKLSCGIIEIKHADSIASLKKEAENALLQIEKKQYDKETEGYQNVLHWGMAFFQKWCIALVKKEKTQ